MPLLLATLLACGPKISIEAATAPPPADLAPRGEVVETLHGVEVADPYRWMEDADSQAVTDWTDARNATFGAYTDGLAQRGWLYERFQQLWRYDDEGVPSPCLLGDRIIQRTKKADQDKWVIHLFEGPDDATGRVILDPTPGARSRPSRASPRRPTAATWPTAWPAAATRTPTSACSTSTAWRCSTTPSRAGGRAG